MEYRIDTFGKRTWTMLIEGEQSCHLATGTAKTDKNKGGGTFLNTGPKWEGFLTDK